MAQNAISGKLKLKIFLGEHIARLLALGNHGFLSFMTIYRIPSAPPVLSAFRRPCSGFTENLTESGKLYFHAL